MSRKQINTHPVEGFKGKGLKHSFCLTPHYCMPGLSISLSSNINNTDEAIQYYSLPDRFNLPTPYVEFTEIESRIDTVMDLVNLKIQWKCKNDQLLDLCKKKMSLSTLNDIKNTLVNDDIMHTTIPYCLTRFSLNLMENPDQYFDSEYNWYFRNTIEKFQINGKWYLACARGENLNSLNIISINNNTFETVEIKENILFEDPIFDIKSSNSNELMIRQKQQLFIFWNNTDTETLLNNNSIFENCDVPLVDADIISDSFCTADVKHVIKLWKDRNCVQNKYFEVKYDQTDSFMQLSYLQNQTDVITIIDRQKLYSIDTRTDISKPCRTYDPSTILEKCEELTTFKNSHLNSHCIYSTSNHSVLTLDNRMGFVHKSYHMLSNPPSLITTHCYENSLEPNEMLILGNQSGENLINLSYTSLQDDFLVSQNIASSIPKPLDSLHDVRLQGHCLNPMLMDRFSRCLIGATAFGEHFEDFRLFSINSVGDLFVQRINNNTSIDVNTFKDLIEVKSQTVKKLNYSKLINVSKLWQLESPIEQKKLIENNHVWSISKEKITSYVDHLAPLMLSPWDIDDLSEWESDNDSDEVSDNSDCDYATKVQYWFNKNDLLLESGEHSQSIIDTQDTSGINFSSQTTTTINKKNLASEKDEDSSSGYTVSLNSEAD